MTNDPVPSTKGFGIPLLIAAICLVATACWVAASGDNLPGKPKPADRPTRPTDVLDFAALYSTNCAACHGAKGVLGPAPPLNNSLFRAIVPQDVLLQVITAGRAGTPMPGFDSRHGGRLTAAQIQVLVYQIKGVAYRIVLPASAGPGAREAKVVEDPAGTAPAWGLVAAPPGEPPPYLASPRGGSDAARRALYRRACADCHGAKGEGGDTGGAINRPEFLALASDQMLRRIIITGRPDLGMPDYASDDERAADYTPMNSQEVDELVALLGQWRHGSSSTSKSK